MKDHVVSTHMEQAHAHDYTATSLLRTMCPSADQLWSSPLCAFHASKALLPADASMFGDAAAYSYSSQVVTLPVGESFLAAVHSPNVRA